MSREYSRINKEGPRGFVQREAGLQDLLPTQQRPGSGQIYRLGDCRLKKPRSRPMPGHWYRRLDWEERHYIISNNEVTVRPLRYENRSLEWHQTDVHIKMLDKN